MTVGNGYHCPPLSRWLRGGHGAGDRGRLKVWVELRQTATGSLLWVHSKLLVRAVASEAYLIFDPGPLRKIPDTPKGVSGILVPVTGVEPVRFLRRGILSPLCLPIPPHRRWGLF